MLFSPSLSSSYKCRSVISCHRERIWASLIAQLVKNPPAMQETLVRFLGQEDPLEKGKTTHSSILPGEFHGLCIVHGVAKIWTQLATLTLTSLLLLKKAE